MNALDLQLSVGTMTVLMEAGGEPYDGKLAVAYVICNSCGYWKRTITDECLKAYRYSCWLTGSATLVNLDKATESLLAECTKAMLAAVYQLEPDPTNGAVFYLNPIVVLEKAKRLPRWWDIDGDPDSQVDIGAHLFRRHRNQTVAV